MRHQVEVEGRVCTVTVERVGDAFAVEVDGRAWSVDAARIDAHTLSLIVATVSRKGDKPDQGGGSYEVVLSPAGAPGSLLAQVGPTPVAVTLNGRRRHKEDGAGGGSGPQRVAAPMPGKVVRLLVRVGDQVAARQPLVVVEAMKMENELRAARPGTVTEIRVTEGTSVDAGALLLVIGQSEV